MVLLRLVGNIDHRNCLKDYVFKRTPQLKLGVYGIKQKPPWGGFCFTYSVLATSYSRLATTIASTGLNCRVRNENGCDPSDESPELKTYLTFNYVLDDELDY